MDLSDRHIVVIGTRNVGGVGWKFSYWWNGERLFYVKMFVAVIHREV